MRYGIYVPCFGPYGDPELLYDLAVGAEAAGWDGFFMSDHVVLPPPVADPWVTPRRGRPRDERDHDRADDRAALPGPGRRLHPGRRPRVGRRILAPHDACPRGARRRRAVPEPAPRRPGVRVPAAHAGRSRWSRPTR